jgi:Zn-dependent protease
MLPTQQGSFRLFRLFGIDVFLHWYWFLFAVFRITGNSSYSSFGWNALEYLALFLIVLMHEFGHALACRSVGGTANLIVLWPFGGVAYVSPPQRAGAQLWSIAAGPLVNVALVPVLHFLVVFSRASGWPDSHPDLHLLFWWIRTINYGLLFFNMLPVYPLDGGQILRSLLWFVFGRAQSLMIASVIGFIGVAALLAYAFSIQSIWLGVLAGVIVIPACWRGFLQAKELNRLEKAPRHVNFSCPSCHASPLAGDFWVCGKCQTAFDTFTTHAMCPNCQTQFSSTACLECGEAHPLSEWGASVPPRL